MAFEQERYGLWRLSVQGGASCLSTPQEDLPTLDSYQEYEVALFNGEKEFLLPSQIQRSLGNLNKKFTSGRGAYITKEELNRIRNVLFRNTDKKEIEIPDWRTRGLPVLMIAKLKVILDE